MTIVEASPTMILSGTYNPETDITSFHQFYPTDTNLIAKAVISLDHANRTISNELAWKNREDVILESLKDLDETILISIFENFPIEVLKNYLK